MLVTKQVGSICDHYSQISVLETYMLFNMASLECVNDKVWGKNLESREGAMTAPFVDRPHHSSAIISLNVNQTEAEMTVVSVPSFMLR